MKTAKLHNGIELSFSDDTPDKVIDDNVKGILAAQKEKKPEYNAVTMVLDGLYMRMEKRFGEIKNTLLALPKTLERTDLKTIENSMGASEDNLAKIVKSLAPLEKNSTSIAEQVEALLHAVADNNPSKSIDQLKKEISSIAKSIEKSFNSAIRDSQEKFRSQLLTMFENHAAEIKKIVDSSTASLEKTSQENTLVMVDALTAPKEIVFDKKTGRPVGVKVKE